VVVGDMEVEVEDAASMWRWMEIARRKLEACP